MLRQLRGLQQETVAPVVNALERGERRLVIRGQIHPHGHEIALGGASLERLEVGLEETCGHGARMLARAARFALGSDRSAVRSTVGCSRFSVFLPIWSA